LQKYFIFLLFTNIRLKSTIEKLQNVQSRLDYIKIDQYILHLTNKMKYVFSNLFWVYSFIEWCKFDFAIQYSYNWSMV